MSLKCQMFALEIPYIKDKVGKLENNTVKKMDVILQHEYYKPELVKNFAKKG